MAKIIKNEDQPMPFDIKKWHSSRKVKILDMETRMVWFEMLCLMWQSEDRGYLTYNNKPILIISPAVQTGVQTPVLTIVLSTVIPCAEDILTKAILKMYDLNVFSVTRDGIIYNRYMIKREKEKSFKSKAGKASYAKRMSNLELFDEHSVGTSVRTPDETPVLTPDETSVQQSVDLLFRARALTTTTNSIKDISIVVTEDNTNTLNNNSSSSAVETAVRTGVQTEKFGYAGEFYKISRGNQGLDHPISVCLWNYFENSEYEQMRWQHFQRFGYDISKKEDCELLLAWAKAFNRGLVNDGTLAIPMISNGGTSSWVRYFPNWAIKVISARSGEKIDPNILFTKDDVKKSQSAGAKAKLTDDKPRQKNYSIPPRPAKAN